MLGPREVPAEDITDVRVGFRWVRRQRAEAASHNAVLLVRPAGLSFVTTRFGEATEAELG